jgi:hypothetical protein
MSVLRSKQVREEAKVFSELLLLLWKTEGDENIISGHLACNNALGCKDCFFTESATHLF